MKSPRPLPSPWRQPSTFFCLCVIWAPLGTSHKWSHAVFVFHDQFISRSVTSPSVYMTLLADPRICQRADTWSASPFGGCCECKLTSSFVAQGSWSPFRVSQNLCIFSVVTCLLHPLFYFRNLTFSFSVWTHWHFWGIITRIPSILCDAVISPS